MSKGRNISIFNIAARGNILTYSIESGRDCSLVIFDPTGEHGAENALEVITEKTRPTTERQLLDLITLLEDTTRGQFELMKVNTSA